MSAKELRRHAIGHKNAYFAQNFYFDKISKISINICWAG